MRLANLRLQSMLRQCGLDPRDEIAPIGLVVGMLELASAALGEMMARRILVMRSRRKRSVVEQRVARDSKCHVSAA